ncbi:MAG: 3'(2'),5'-bisphosphate nucleotidase CysQ [Kangiellaceae bacterium]|nr:3'(2'),5'-bisphosphate nucleotidase CysQ [Kangiellaceae bacterium]
MQQLLDDVIEIAKLAGKKILEIYNTNDFDIQIKDDDSPLTRADLAAHHCIVDFLEQKYPEIPCLSEESTGITFAERKDWNECFIIDPLDGTKEFIARNGEFTVNIALQKNGRSVLGVIYVPVADIVYYAADGIGAFKQEQNDKATSIRVRKLQTRDNRNHFTVVASRRNGLDKVETLCQNFSSYDLTSSGSSLKMCMVAEGSADLYPRLALTSEWDTAAAQAIVEQSGGRIVQLDFSEMTYNQKENILNPYFLVLGDPEVDWQQELVIPSVESL